VIIMAIGDSGSHVPSSAPGQDNHDNSARVGKHVTGSGPMPGTGASAGPSDQADSNSSK
jgi:hypothetical protein